jgi:hypothetical protein
MKLPGLGLVLVFALTGCNDRGTTQQQINDNNAANNLTHVSDVSNQANKGKAIGKKYGGKGTGYGQVKKRLPENVVPPLMAINEGLSNYLVSKGGYALTDSNSQMKWLDEYSLNMMLWDVDADYHNPTNVNYLIIVNNPQEVAKAVSDVTGKNYMLSAYGTDVGGYSVGFYELH